MSEKEGFTKNLENGNLLVETKDGKFELEEKDWETIERAKKRAEAAHIDEDIAMLSCSIVKVDDEEKKIGELDVSKLKGSSVLRLKYAINKLYGLMDFLSELKTSNIDLKTIQMSQS